ncbi:MAG: zinc-dependent alcohol dehydrogenase [Promethearchaeota archaeon]|jgi:threonine dehydrogenase-like Zn-dependent dehydrogenase
MMKRVVLQEGRAWVEECSNPEPMKGWVIAKILLTPICGSDKKAFIGKTPTRNAGHEGVGVVVDSGNSNLVKNGDRVVLNPLTGCGMCDFCRSGDYIYCEHPNFGLNNIENIQSHFTQYVKIPDFLCSLIPDDITDEIGTLAGCALGPAFTALERMSVSTFDTLLITGLGPVGLGALVIAKYRGARVIAVEVEEYRRNLAREMGADIVLEHDERHVNEAIIDLTHGKGLKKAIDCSGHPKAERLCLDLVGKKGMVAFVGENFGQIPIYPSNDFIRKGLILFGAWHFNLNNFNNIIKILRCSPVVGKIITHKYGFSQVQEAFEVFMSGKTGKVILNPWE